MDIFDKIQPYSSVLFTSFIYYLSVIFLDITSGVMTDLKGTSHAFVVLEKDMTHNDQSSNSHTIGKKSTFSVIDTLKNAGNSKRERRKREMFCLETACILMEASYQAYFPLPKEYEPLSVGHDDQRKLKAELKEQTKSKEHDTVEEGQKSVDCQKSVDSLVYTESQEEENFQAYVSKNGVIEEERPVVTTSRETANVVLNEDLSPLFDTSPITTPNSYPSSPKPMSKFTSKEMKDLHSNGNSDSSLDMNRQILLAPTIEGHPGTQEIDPVMVPPGKFSTAKNPVCSSRTNIFYFYSLAYILICLLIIHERHLYYIFYLNHFNSYSNTSRCANKYTTNSSSSTRGPSYGPPPYRPSTLISLQQ
jgi:hypothetical protein